jgi:transcriptional regulator with XRE-family HTH domain
MWYTRGVASREIAGGFYFGGTVTTLKALRLIGGRSVTEIAREISVDRADLSRIERGLLKPYKSAAERLAVRFGLEIDTLLADAGTVLAVREP